MTKKEQAQIILEHLDEYIQVNYAMEEFYLKGIVNGLMEVDRQEKKKNE